jgi:WD40 repeat protein
MDARRLERLRRRLNNRWPLIGWWLRRRAVRALAAEPSPEVLTLLAATVATHFDEAVRRIAREELSRREPPADVGPVASTWAATRHPDLIFLLGQWGQVPAGPPGVRIPLALKLGRIPLATATPADGVGSLLQCCSDGDPDIARGARTALRQLSDPEAIQELCQTWMLARTGEAAAALAEARYVADLGAARVFSALAVGRREELRDLPPELAVHLHDALNDGDAALAEQAELLVGELQRPDTLAVLAVPICERWAATRSARLGELVTRCQFVAGQPVGLRVLSALKSNQGDQLLDEGPEAVEPLARACDDVDPQVAGNARMVLRRLRKTATREAVCQLFLEHDNLAARDAALAAGWLPEGAGDRALFLFLSEQWDRYDIFDFDRRLLAAIHESASPELKQRITEKLRTAGRPDFLSVLAGADYRARVSRMEPEEADFLVSLLIQHGEWSRLWNLVFELPLRSSVGVVRLLARQGWRPEREDERSTLVRLAELADDRLVAAVEQHRELPPAVMRARVRVSGSVNDVAFSPARPLVALGSNKGRVVLWNYATGQIEQTLGEPSHSIGLVAFAADDTLVAAERRQSAGDPNQVHVWRGDKHTARTYRSAVRGIEPVAEGQVLLSFRDNERDGRVALFDTGPARLVKEEPFSFWCRAVRVSPDRSRAALLHKGINVVSLPDLMTVARTSSRDIRRVVSAGSFINPAELIVGHQGDLLLCRQQEGLLLPGPPWGRHGAEVRSLELLREGSVVLSASTDGLVRLTERGSSRPPWEFRTQGRRLTSLHVTPGGEFMVLGDTDQTMSFWDLRPLSLPDLFSRPLAHSLPVHLAAISALADDADLPEGLGAVLRYTRTALQHRFRYDIEVDELPPAIRAGEFDIEIEG